MTLASKHSPQKVNTYTAAEPSKNIQRTQSKFKRK